MADPAELVADDLRPLTRREEATEHEVLDRRVVRLILNAQRLDPLARADAPDAVHQLRVCLRRLRSTLTTFEKCFDGSATDQLGDELAWIGDLLGRPRDLEVLGAHLDRMLLELPAEAVRGRMDSWIGEQLSAEQRVAHHVVLDEMGSERYSDLLQALDSWRDAPRWRDVRERHVSKRLPTAVDRAWAEMEQAASRAAKVDEADRMEALHDVRKAARRTRYAAETLAPFLGSDLRKTARRAKKIQTVLGKHHDAALASARVLQLADAAHAAGQDTFTLGVLHARLTEEAAAHERSFQRGWRRLGIH